MFSITAPPQSAIDLDPIAAAEEATGVIGSEATRDLGLGMFLMNNRIKTAVLKKVGDTYNGMRYDDFTLLIESCGFECVYSESYEENIYGSVEKRIKRVHWSNALSALIISDDYCGDLNSGNMYFELNIDARHKVYAEKIGCSSSCRCPIHGVPQCDCPDSSLVFAMDLDVREGLFLNIQKMSDVGIDCFNEKWVSNSIYGLTESKEEFGLWKVCPSKMYLSLPEELQMRIPIEKSWVTRYGKVKIAELLKEKGLEKLSGGELRLMHSEKKIDFGDYNETAAAYLKNK